MDGFGHTGSVYQVYGKWDFISTSYFSYGSTYGRTGGWGASMVGAYTLWRWVPETTTIVIGEASYIDTLSSTANYWAFYDTDTLQVGIRMMVDGSISAYRGTTLLGSSSVGVVSDDKWEYIEAKVTFSATVGSVEVLVNGDQVLNLTNQNTISSANTSCNKVIFAPLGKIDDLYICDTTGTVNNDFLGDVTITALYPTSDETNSDFTPSSGVDNYLMVDDPQINDATTYNISETVGHKDSFGMTTSAVAGDILGVQVAVVAGSDTGGAINLQTLILSGDTPTETLGTAKALSITPQSLVEIYEEEPIDSATWTNAIINASEFGVKVES